MLAKTTLTALMTTSLVIIGASNVSAEEKDPLSLSLSVGAEYDNNITVDAIDVTSQVGDESALLDGSIGYAFVNNGDVTVKTSYSFSQTLHLDLSQFDLQIHGVSLAATTKVNDIDVGIAYRYNNIRLGNKSFLEMHSVNPTFSTLVGTKTLILGGYEYLKQNFKQPLLLSRNANRHSVNIKSYFLLGNGRTINIGYKLTRHKTVAANLVYWGHTFDAGFKLPVEAIEGAKFKVRYRYRQKDYSNITQSLGAKRADKYHSIRARLEIPVFKQFTAKLQYQYIKSKSNLAVINYDDHRISARIGWKL